MANVSLCEVGHLCLSRGADYTQKHKYPLFFHRFTAVIKGGVRIISTECGLYTGNSTVVSGFDEISYEERLCRLRSPSLLYRRKRGDMIQTYKIMRRFDRIDPAPKSAVTLFMPDPAYANNCPKIKVTDSEVPLSTTI